jgi:methylenetetrahydrofolate dehydrogenase (NADP+)/methenyltetrahydrofolate cyclohydrolase
MAQILDGRLLAQTMQTEIAARVAIFTQKHGFRPGLAAVLVGDNPASQIYVRNKRKACENVGLQSWQHQLPRGTTQEELLRLIEQLNCDSQVSGILVQLPLPKAIAESTIIGAVAPLKDVDGFGPESLGLLMAGHPRFLPCTPLGVQQNRGQAACNDADAEGKPRERDGDGVP